MTARAPRRGSRFIRRLIVLLLIAAIAAVTLFYVGGGWFFSNQLRQEIDGQLRREALTPVYDLTVTAVDSETITIQMPVEDPPNEIDTGEIWALRWRSPSGVPGWGHVGAVVSKTAEEVQREFIHVSDPPVVSNAAANLTSFTYLDNPLSGLGLEYEDIDVAGELGSYPAWFVPGEGDTWVIIVHGNSLSRLDGMRMLANTSEMGYPSLVISLRNAPGAPEDPSGLLRYGVTEWRDIEAAVRYALDQGSDGVVLSGYSMGGGTIVRFLLESDLASEVKAAVLDSPVLSFESTVDYAASLRTVPVLGIAVPSSLTEVAKFISQWRFEIDWEEWDNLTRIDELDTPILVIHGDADRTVPLETSRTLVNQRRDIVQLVVIPGAEHVQSWNIDRETYEDRYRSFLTAQAP